MCGIAGYIGKGQVGLERVGPTLHLMKNRGPDNQAHVAVARGLVNIDFLHSRLSIIDLDERANQPFRIGRCTLIFNGEIYNYLEIRKELKELGIVFRTNSDTEVLLQSYLVWGEKCVDKFEGMWAFALYDAREQKLVLSRDRFAEKPLYFVEADKGIYFGSEVKFIQALMGRALKINQRQIRRYLVNGYKSLYKTPETFYEDLREVPFATNMVVDSEMKVEERRYWQPRYRPSDMTEEEAVERTRQALLNSMKIRLRSDVPLAFCLSGGVDSGALASIAAKELGHEVVAFSIVDSDKRYNEYDNIMATVKDIGCQHTVVNLKPGGLLGQLKELVAYHDAPVATITYFVHSFLSRAMAEQGYKVSFSGTAADELFTGYYDHHMWYLAEMKGQKEFKRRRREWEEQVKPRIRDPLLQDAGRYINNPERRDHIFLDNEKFAAYLNKEWQEEFREEKYEESVLHNRMLNELFHEATRVILHEDDLNSMRYSIENRSPYLDKNLFEVAYSIPSRHLIKNGYAKYILRQAADGILNDQVCWDRQKKGFNASIHSIIDVNNKRDRDYLLSDGPIFDLVNREKIAGLLDERSLPNSFSKFLFNFINAKIFLEQSHGVLPKVYSAKHQAAVSA